MQLNRSIDHPNKQNSAGPDGVRHVSQKVPEISTSTALVSAMFRHAPAAGGLPKSNWNFTGMQFPCPIIGISARVQ